MLFAHIPREEDELELMIGDHVYVTPEEVAGSTDGWLVGTSWLTGCQGYLPKNYIQQTAETNSWTSHLTLPMTTVQASVQDSHKPSSRTSSCSSSLERLKGKNHSSSLNRQNDSKLTTTTTTTDGNEPPTAATAVEVLEERGEEIRIQRISEPRRVFVVRHGERVDFTFGSWIPYCFDEKGTYKQKDLNMPVSVPQRKSGPEGFLRDCPLTCIGLTQATLLGEALKAAGVSFSHAFVSPSLRCIQTCHNILKGLGLQQSIKMNIEPGIFEWLAWHQNAMPDWIGPEELLEAGYNIDCKYKPYISAEELQDTEETSEQYFTRNFFVTQCILQSTEGLGGNLLFVAHASSLDTCTRQIVGEAPRAMTELMQVVRKVPYCAMSVIEEGGNRGGAGKKDGRKDKFSWKLVDPPVPPMTHCSNARFNWELLTDSGGQATQGLKNRQDPRAKGENTSMEF